MKYQFLADKICERGIRKSVIAQRLGIASKSLSSKICGRTRFAYDEAQIIHHDFFPDIPLDELFMEVS